MARKESAGCVRLSGEGVGSDMVRWGRVGVAVFVGVLYIVIS